MSTIRENITDAIKFWERGRILYNVALAIVVVVHFIAAYPLSKAALSLNSALGLFLLAVVANIAYCAAYPVDLFAQWSGFRDVWRKYRWALLALGITFAAVITHFVSGGIFIPEVNTP
jgi:energy-coupling factor transporter transmembrane protein EcfT